MNSNGHHPSNALNYKYPEMALSTRPEKEEIHSESDSSAAPDLTTTDAEKVAPTETDQDSTASVFVRRYKGWSWLLVCAATYSSAFLYGLDTTIVADIQPFAVEQFGDVENLGWLGIGFPLGSVATILSFSKAYGMFDVKWYRCLKPIGDHAMVMQWLTDDLGSMLPVSPCSKPAPLSVEVRPV